MNRIMNPLGVSGGPVGTSTQKGSSPQPCRAILPWLTISQKRKAQRLPNS